MVHAHLIRLLNGMCPESLEGQDYLAADPSDATVSTVEERAHVPKIPPAGGWMVCGWMPYMYGTRCLRGSVKAF